MARYGLKMKNKGELAAWPDKTPETGRGGNDFF